MTVSFFYFICMLKNRFLFIFIFLFTAQVMGQNVRIEGQFTSTAGFEKLSLVCFLDSLHVITQTAFKEGAFTLEAKNIKPGIYRLQYGPHPIEHGFDKLFSGEDSNIILQMDLGEGHKNPVFTGSLLNSKLHNYLKVQNDLLMQLRFNYQAYQNAPSKSQEEALISQKAFQKKHKKLFKLRNVFLKDNANNLAGLYVKFHPFWLPQLKSLSEERFKNFWLSVPKPEEQIKNTPFYHNCLTEYLSFYFNQRIEPAAWEFQMKQAIDSVLQYMGKTSNK